MKITKTNPGAFGTRVNNEVVIITEGENIIDDSVWKQLKKNLVILARIELGEFIVEDVVVRPYVHDEDEYESFNAGDAIEYIESINNEEELLVIYDLESNDKKRKTVIDKIYQIADELEIDLDEE